MIKKFLSRPEVIVLSLSLGITTLISFLISLGFYIYSKNFWSPFFITLGVQLLFFIIYNTILQKKDVNRLQEMEIMALEGLSKFTIGVQCSYCKQQNNVPITLNKENRFSCTSCNQVNGIKMQFFTTQLTTPITSNPIDKMIEATSKTSDVQNL